MYVKTRNSSKDTEKIALICKYVNMPGSGGDNKDRRSTKKWKLYKEQTKNGKIYKEHTKNGKIYKEQTKNGKIYKEQT